MNPHLQTAIDALQAGQKQQAVTSLRQALQEEPRNPTAWVWLARALDDPQKQNDCLQRALQIDPNHSFALSTQTELNNARPAARPAALRSLRYEDIETSNPFQSGVGASTAPTFSADPQPDPESTAPAFIFDANDPFLSAESQPDLSVFQPQNGNPANAPFDFSGRPASPFSTHPAETIEPAAPAFWQEAEPQPAVFWQEPEPQPEAEPLAWQAPQPEPEPEPTPTFWQQSEPETPPLVSSWRDPQPAASWKEPEPVYTPRRMPWEEEEEAEVAPQPERRKSSPKSKSKTKPKAKAKPKPKARSTPKDRPDVQPGEIILRILFILLVLFGIIIGIVILMNGIQP